MQAILTVGISASGKSTFAKDLVSHGWVDVNRDDIRFDTFCNGVRDWKLYKFSKEKENQVTVAQERLVDAAALHGQNVIISDTNINDKTRNFWINRLTGLGYNVQVQYFDIDLIEALERDAKRCNGVGYKVITDQYARYMKLRHGDEYHKHVNGRKHCIIVDIDNTIADMKGIRTPFEWDKVDLDLPIEHTIEIVQLLKEQGYEIIFMSGRDACCATKTRLWLDKHTGITDSYLLMRNEGDNRKDTIVKKELFYRYINNNFNVHFVLDDRPCVLRMWNYEVGLKTLAVGNFHNEF